MSTPNLAEGPSTRWVTIELVITRVCHFKRKVKHPKTGKKQLGCARCTKPRSHPDHMGQPPSMNIFGSGNIRAYQGFKRAWHDVLKDKLEASALPKDLSRVYVEGEVTFPIRPTEKGPDQGNFRAPLEKVLGDVLQEGWLPSDCWARYEFGRLSHRYERGVSSTRLTITAEKGSEPAPLAVAG